MDIALEAVVERLGITAWWRRAIPASPAADRGAVHDDLAGGDAVPMGEKLSATVAIREPTEIVVAVGARLYRHPPEPVMVGPCEVGLRGEPDPSKLARRDTARDRLHLTEDGGTLSGTELQ